MDNKKSKMRKKTTFKRQQQILKKLKEKWRKPKGLHSKLRLKKRGKGKRPKIGYGKEKESKHFTKGIKPIYIHQIKDIECKKEPIIISSRLGLKKKLEIIKKAKEMNLKIINIKDIDKFLQEINKNKEEKNNLKKDKRARKEEKSKKDQKKEESKEEKEDKMKQEKRKVLEKGL